MGEGAYPKIRFSGHLGLVAPDAPLFAHSAASPAPIDQICYLAEQGFSGLFDPYVKMRSPVEQREISGALQHHGLRFGTFNNDLTHWNQPVWNVRSADTQHVLQASLASSADIARQFPQAKAVCVTGVDASQSHGKQMDAMIRNLRDHADQGQDAGLTLLVEAVAPQWIGGLFVTHTAQAADIVRAVDHPAVRLLFDTGHAALAGEDVLDALRRQWDIIDTIQLADAPDRGVPGQGCLAWDEIFRLLAQRQFAGAVELEFQPISSPQGEADILPNLRKFLSEI